LEVAEGLIGRHQSVLRGITFLAPGKAWGRGKKMR